MGDVADPATSPALLLDANVVIDYRRSDPDILPLAARHLAPLAMIPAVMREVDDFGRAERARLGIEALVPTDEQALQAEQYPSGISIPDRLCFVVCDEGNWICVTNDRKLQNLCERHGITTKYGLRLMLDLVVLGVLSRSRAAAVARRIREVNPKGTTEEILARFLSQLDKAVSR